MNIYEKRWNAVKKFVETKINPLLSNPDYTAAYDGDLMSIHDPIEIDEENKEMIINLGHNCSVCIYNGDPEFDEGVHSTIEETITDLRERLEIFKAVRF